MGVVHADVCTIGRYDYGGVWVKFMVMRSVDISAVRSTVRVREGGVTSKEIDHRMTWQKPI